MKNTLTTILVACAIFGCNTALAADRSITERKIPLDVPRAGSAIVLDGVLDEAAWQNALRVTLDWETYPAENIGAFAMTEGFVTYSNDTLYVAFIAHDPDPSKIRAHLTDRDRMFQDDFAGVVLDTFNDERRGFEFFVNPLGVQGDLFKDDIAGNEDSSFDTIWDSVGRITDKGYIIEIAIPFYSLRFKGSVEPIIWGIDFVRIMPRDERHQFRTYKADRNLACYICEFQKYRGFAGADPGNNLEIVPTLTAARSDQRPDYDEPYERGDSEFEPSVDVKWGITPNIILNATLNPDFSQVEADIAQLEVNNQFALFYPERRTFFLEGQDIFDDPFGIVYTRNIADPDHGAKITGKEGNHVFGAFFTDDSLTNLIFPGPSSNEFESFEFDSRNAVARYRFDLGENSTLGALATDRSGDGYRNSVLAIDSKIRLSDSDTLNFEIIESETEYSDQMVADFAQPAGQFTDTSVYAGYSRNAREHNFYVEYVEVGEDFRADLGFLPQVGYKQPVIGGGYIWHGDGDDWYRRIRLNGDIDQTHDTATGQELETEAEAYLSMNSGMQSYLELGAIRRRQFWDGVMYQQTLNQFFGEFQPSAAVYANFYVRHGDSIDYANSRAGRQLQINPELTLRPGRQLNADLRFTYDRLNVDGGRLFTARITELRTTWQFTAQMFVRWITQYRTLDREASLYTFAVEPNERSWGNQLLFSYKLNPRTLFFAGYSDGYAGSHELDLQRQHKTLFFKFSYAWQL